MSDPGPRARIEEMLAVRVAQGCLLPHDAAAIRLLMDELDAARAATPARSDAGDGLDVERLARAIHQTHDDDDPNNRPYCPACLDDAKRYAAEYARLVKDPTDER